MRKQRVIDILDVVIVFNVFVFVGVGLVQWTEALIISLIFLGYGLFNVLYFLYIVKLRINFNKRLEADIISEAKVEEDLSQDEKDQLYKSKQNLLENRIEAEITTKWPDAKIIKHAYVPKGNGAYSEIDLIVISSKGIFIIEAKNMSGTIKGDWKEEYLSIDYPSGKTFPLYNPIFQNNMHYKYLRSILGMDSNYFRSVIVLGDRMFIESRPFQFHVEICYLKDLIKSLDRISARYFKKHQLIIEEHIIESTYDTLLHAVQETKQKHDQHILNIKQDKMKKDRGTSNE